MKNKTIFRRAMCVLLIFAILPLSGMAAEPSPMDVFNPNPLVETAFTDLSREDPAWDYVQLVCANGLMEGTGADAFTPEGTVPVTQVVGVSVRIYEKYRQIPDESQDYGDLWYEYYIDRAREYGLLPGSLATEDLARPATLGETAQILSAALPAEELQPRFQADSLPDCGPEDPWYEGVSTLYAAGVLLGDDYGKVHPDNRLLRRDLATLAARLVYPAFRAEPETVTVTLPDILDAPLPQSHRVPGMEAFGLSQSLQTMPFTDVPADSWYYEPVETVWRMGLMVGMSDTAFSPGGSVRISQVAAVAVRLYEKYHGLADRSALYPSPWYHYYMMMARQYRILPASLRDADPDRAATREEVAAILAAALPLSELPALNTVEELPDYDGSSLYFDQVLLLYRAGILRGDDEYGTFRPTSQVRRCELAAMLTRLTLPETREVFTLTPFLKTVIEELTYGKSGAGRELKAYRYGGGENVMVLTFAIHGWEDNFDRDGQMLVDTAYRLMDRLEKEYETLIRAGDWSVYVLPCLNPDGLLDGWTCNGPGRCTVYGLDSQGNNTYNRGIDLNRCFPYAFSASYSGRYYTGAQPLMAREAQALASFIPGLMGEGHNILIDAHGWYRQTIVSGGSGGAIYQAFARYFPGNRYTSLRGASGYLSSWAAYTLGYDACLFEFPSVSSAADFRSKGYAQDYVDAICYLLQTYTG